MQASSQKVSPLRQLPAALQPEAFLPTLQHSRVFPYRSSRKQQRRFTPGIKRKLVPAPHGKQNWTEARHLGTSRPGSVLPFSQSTATDTTSGSINKTFLPSDPVKAESKSESRLNQRYKQGKLAELVELCEQQGGSSLSILKAVQAKIKLSQNN